MTKTIALAVLSVAAVALGVLYAQELGRTKDLAGRIAELETKVAGQNTEIRKKAADVAATSAERERLAAKVESTKKRLTEARAATAEALTAPSPSPTAEAASETAVADKKPGGKRSGPFSGSVARMMKDPAMKKMMRSAQGTMLRQTYGDLIKQWNATPEEANTFYDLLLDRQEAMMASTVSEDSGDGSVTVVNSMDKSDAALKASLGDQMYAQYKDYEKTVGDRMSLSQFKLQLDGANIPALSTDQSQFLLSTMAEVRASQPAASAYPDFARLGKTGAFSDADVEAFTKSQSDQNEKVATRAATMLTPAQLTAFKQYQTQMLDMQKMGMQMAAKMNAAGGP